MYQCLGFVIMEDRSFNRGFPPSVRCSIVNCTCYCLHYVEILLINTWMNGWMDTSERRQCKIMYAWMRSLLCSAFRITASHHIIGDAFSSECDPTVSYCTNGDANNWIADHIAEGGRLCAQCVCCVELRTRCTCGIWN